MNSVNLVGRLTKDPELIDGKTKICELRLAVNGQGETPPLFIDVASFKGQAEACAKYLVKGSLVAVTGSLRYGEWESGGSKRSKHSVLAREVRFLDRKSGKDGKAGE
jgi:single-strand DNA-binding protein